MIKININKKNEVTITIKGKSEFFRVNVKDIAYITYGESETTVHLVNGAKYPTMHKLKDFDEILKKYGCFQANRQTLINLEHSIFARITRKERNVFVNGISIEVARKRVALLKELIC